MISIKKMLKNKNKKIKKNTKTNIEFIRSTAFNYDKDVSNQEQQLELKL